MAALNAEITRQAEMIAYLNDFKLMMYVSLAGLPLLPMLRRRPAAPAAMAPRSRRSDPDGAPSRMRNRGTSGSRLSSGGRRDFVLER